MKHNMKMIIKIKNKIKCMAAIVLAGILAFGCVPVMAETKTVDLEELRAMQEGIVNWKTEAMGEDELLSGTLLDHAGEPGSDWYAFAGSRSGLVTGQAAYLSRLQDHVEEIYSNLEENVSQMKATDWHRMALTVLACGGDPTAFGVDAEGNPINLVEDGTWNCLTGNPGKQGINGYAWALYLLDSKNYEIPEGSQWTRESIVDAILEKQYEDGGFALGSAESSDADITAIVLTALAPYGADPEVQSAADAAFARLSAIQHSDGTMVSYGERTSESTCWTLIALSAWNRDARTDEMFIKNGNTLYDGLKCFLLEDGSFIHSLDASEPETEGNNVSVYQAFYAIEAGCRQIEGKSFLFDLTDAETVSQEEIDKAGEALSDLKETAEDNGEGSKNLLTIVLVGAVIVVLVVVVLLFVLFRDKKKTKNGETFAPDEDDDDEW